MIERADKKYFFRKFIDDNKIDLKHKACSKLKAFYNGIDNLNEFRDGAYLNVFNKFIIWSDTPQGADFWWNMHYKFMLYILKESRKYNIIKYKSFFKNYRETLFSYTALNDNNEMKNTYDVLVWKYIEKNG